MDNKQKYVLGFIFSPDLTCVLLIQKNKSPKGLEKMISKLNGVGGKQEFGEKPFEAMRRECLEETGLDIKIWNYYCNLDTKFGEVFCFYTVSDKIWTYQQKESEELDIYQIDECCYPWLCKNERMPNLNWLIPMALNHYKGLDQTNVFLIKETYNT